MKLDDLRAANIQRSKELAKQENPTDLAQWSNGLAGEYGELIEAFFNYAKTLKVCNTTKKILREANGDPNTKDLLENLKDEIGDIIISLDLLCNKLNISLSESVKNKFNKTSNKRNSTVFI